MVLAPLQFSGRSLTPDVAGGIQQGQQILQGENILEQQRQGIRAAERKQGQQQQASQLIRRQQAGGQIQTGSELAQLMVDNPQLAENVLKASGISTEFQKNDLAQFGFKLEQADPAQQQQLIQQRIQAVQARGGNPQDTAALVGANPQKVGQFARTVQLAALSNEERLNIAQGGKQGLASAVTKILEDGSSIQALPNQQVNVRNPAGELVTGQARLDVLKRASEAQIEQKRRLSKVAVEEAGATAEAKAGVDLRFKPAIRTAVKLAEKAAAARGETLTTLQRAEAALPGLIETVDTLKELAPIVTSTIGGKVFDFAVKESGFGATKGATARAKFIAIVSNQVLPLLKETFGAAFTAVEGAELKATMGDPDASPEQKIAQLEAFITQKRRSIQTAQRELSLGTITADDLADLTDEQLAELARSAQ